MLIAISPAKKLDWSPRDIACTAPHFEAEAMELVRVARTLGVEDLRRLMGLSEDLARLNHARFQDYAETPEPEDTRPAAFAFAGDTYQGLEAASLDHDELLWAQDRLRILSGLYGVLRPFDAIQPYRLEMGSRLATDRGRNLYQFWGERISEALNAQAARLGTKWLINCASQEYFGAVAEGALNLRVVTPIFYEEKPAGPKIVSFYAKKARGAMARFVIQHRLTDPEALLDFDIAGYRYVPDLSEADRPAFLRPAQAEAGKGSAKGERTSVGA
ncbi:hypothetical protein SAMN05421688_2077 [Poseidonocella pacifica]|uniref:UPF0246 protein SAMN05421688_2077 n=1 Tax=Poseidonocella pacifica TaxID=871651 RepID=A0A1I0XB20_9RHOB|nr:peroxide stress protein YaaA [Poseidonocella pacifica]SFA98215.1 hypothetical protein SAMN05421688_2077 [Poseidonocella pacifica]